MTVKQRLVEYIKYKGLSNREFCRIVGVSETYVNSMRNSIQPDKLIRIIHAFPDLNTEWLITGKGEMLRNMDMLPPIAKGDLVETSSEVFKDMLLDMFKRGEIFSANIVWEQHKLIIENSHKVNELTKEIERLRCIIEQNHIKLQ